MSRPLPIACIACYGSTLVPIMNEIHGVIVLSKNNVYVHFFFLLSVRR